MAEKLSKKDKNKTRKLNKNAAKEGQPDWENAVNSDNDLDSESRAKKGAKKPRKPKQVSNPNMVKT